MLGWRLLTELSIQRLCILIQLYQQISLQYFIESSPMMNIFLRPCMIQMFLGIISIIDLILFLRISSSQRYMWWSLRTSFPLEIEISSNIRLWRLIYLKKVTLITSPNLQPSIFFVKPGNKKEILSVQIVLQKNVKLTKPYSKSSGTFFLSNVRCPPSSQLFHFFPILPLLPIKRPFPMLFWQAASHLPLLCRESDFVLVEL